MPTKKNREDYRAFKKALLKKGADINVVAQDFGFTSQEALIAKDILTADLLNLSDLIRKYNASRAKVRHLADRLNKKGMGVHKSRAFAPEDLPIVQALKIENPNLTAIAASLGKTPGKVARIAKRLKIKGQGAYHHPLHPDRAEIEEAIKASAAKESNKEISNKLALQGIKISHVSIGKIRKELDLHTEDISARITGLSIAERRLVINDLLLPNPNFIAIAKNHQIFEQTVSRLAKEYWIPSRIKSVMPTVELFTEAAEELVLQHWKSAPKDERQAVLAILKQPKQRRPNVMSNIDGIRPWSIPSLVMKMGDNCWVNRSEFFNAVLDHHLLRAGIKSEKDFAHTEKGYVVLEMPAGIFKALHFAFAARGVIFNRLKVRRAGSAGNEHAPKREELQALAPNLKASLEASFFGKACL